MPDIIKINSFDSPELDVYARFSESQLLNRDHPENGIFIAESPLVIERALNAGCVPISFLAEEKDVDKVISVMKDHADAPIFTAPFDVLTELTGFKLTRGMLSAMKRPPLKTPEELTENSRRVAVLENVMNPTNVGAIIRSAAALGMDAVLLTEGCSDPLYRRAVRVSMGTVFQIPWTFVNTDNISTSQALRLLGFKTAATALSNASIPVSHPALAKEERLAVILGTEGNGLDEKTIAECDYTVKIPMYNGVDSLNVAAASAVVFYELSKR